MKIKYMLVLFIITIVVPPVFSFSSLYEVIDINKLPQERDYISQVKWLIENPSVFRNGRSDGDSAASKDAAILKLKNILEQTNKYITKDSSNIELLLLRILLYWSFYGIAFSEYYNEIIDEGIRIERLFPKEYRTYWFLGTFFAYAARPLESIKQFDYVIKNLKVEKVHPQFWYSYASAAGFADMYKHALVALDKYALFEKEFKLDQDIVYKLSSYLTTPSFDSIIGPESLYQVQEREKGLGLLCRLFGIYMSVSKDWDVQTYEISNNGSMIVFTPEAILNKNDRAIRYSIFMEYNANKKIAFEEYIKTFIKV